MARPDWFFGLFSPLPEGNGNEDGSDILQVA
jgi:hypothetical protein